MCSIRPFLAAVPPALRQLVMFAQAAVVNPQLSPEKAAAATANADYIRHSILWKSKLEAANAMIHHRHMDAAVNLMQEGIKSVESCRNPFVILEALTEIPARLALIDSQKALYLLGVAANLAKTVKRPAAAQRIKEIMLGIQATAKKPLTQP